MTIQPGTDIGRYHILEQLGEGGMAIVFKAYDTRLECDVAVKVIRLDNLPPKGLEKTLARFQAEARRMARMTHVNIIKVIDYGEFEGVPYLVMPFISGGTLKARMGKPVAWREAIRIILPIAEGLAYAHSKEVIHRDVKPGNILISETGDPMLTDFGIAKIVDAQEAQQLTLTGSIVGTPEYMAPEQFTSTQFDHRVDIYALGIVLYEMVTGRKPFLADTPSAVMIKHARDPLPRPSQFVPDLPEAVERVLIKALAKRPQDRYQQMSELAAALRGLASLRTEAERQKFEIVQQNETQAALKKQIEADRRRQMDLKLAQAQARKKDKAEQKQRQQEAKQAAKATAREKNRQKLEFKAEVERKKAKATKLLKNREKRVILPNKKGIFIFGGIIIAALVLAGILMQGNKNPDFPQGTILAENDQPQSTPVVTEATATSIPLTTPAAQYEIGSTLTSPIDGMQMVYVPAGEFMMGAQNPEGDEQPLHSEYLDAFWIDQTEVTTAQFKLCIDAGACSKPGEFSFRFREYSDHPVIYAEYSAAEYCEWAGRRLPSEAEWEKAARGTDGRTYPWGEEIDCEKANFSGCNSFGTTSPVGYFSAAGASPYGAYDMAGNVWELVSNPENTDGLGIARGGGWNADALAARTTSRRTGIRNARNFNGFRCALSAESELAAQSQPAKPAPAAITEFLPTLTPEQKPAPALDKGLSMVSDIDGMVMVLVPAGEFEIGSDDGNDDEKPLHTVYLDAFWIDQTEVTNIQYQRCVDAGNCSIPGAGGSTYFRLSEYADHPAKFVDWYQANEYCQWAKRRLPSEAEWEKAARGTDQRTYPWGEAVDCEKANYSGCDPFSTTSPVGYFGTDGASLYGAYDMAGNVWEWVADWYDVNYYAESDTENPTGPESGTRRVLRGGSWRSDEKYLRSSHRNYFDPNYGSSIYGFRCALSESTELDAQYQLTQSAPAVIAEFLPTATPEQKPALSIDKDSIMVSDMDGMVMVLVPSGEFEMGSGGEEKNEEPIHKVFLDSYWIDQTEVTNAQYQMCVESDGCSVPKNTSSSTQEFYYGNTTFADYPVINVDWNQASDYCTWAGRRLPTEAEWEKAARGMDRSAYPWGNDTPNINLLNFQRSKGDTNKVGSYPEGASPFGVLDMSGNVYEWVSDWYAIYYYGDSPYQNPQGPLTGISHVIRGGSWYSYDPNFFRAAYRRDSSRSDPLIGFRCAMEANEE